MRRATALLTLCTACAPQSVKVVDEWLAGYALLDVERVVANTWVGDRALVKQCVEAAKDDPHSNLALALPPLPLSHEIIEIEKQPGPDRVIVLTKIKMKNPLPYQAEKVGQDLGNFPRTRSQRRRFLSVREGGAWGVKLDLAAVLRRAEFVDAFTLKVEAKAFDDAAAMLGEVPPVPDEANVVKADRLVVKLTAQLEKAKSRLRVRTSSTSTSAAR